MKNIYKVKLLFVKPILVALFTITGTANVFANDKQYNASFEPVRLLFGSIGVSGEYRVTESISIGLHYSYWSRKDSDLDTNESTFSSILPYGRYYFNTSRDGFFAGLGFVNINFESANNDGSTSSFNESGALIEGGYQWRWESFFQELNYARWFLSNIENPSGTDLELSGGPSLTYRVGWYF